MASETIQNFIVENFYRVMIKAKMSVKQNIKNIHRNPFMSQEPFNMYITKTGFSNLCKWLIDQVQTAVNMHVKFYRNIYLFPSPTPAWKDLEHIVIPLSVHPSVCTNLRKLKNILLLLLK